MAKSLKRSDDDFDVDEDLTLDAIDIVDEDIPTKLQKFIGTMCRYIGDKDTDGYWIHQFGVQYNDSTGWKRVKERIRIERGKQPNPEDIGLRLLDISRRHSEKLNKNINYRMWAEIRNDHGEFRMRYCGFTSVQDSSGDIQFYDGDITGDQGRDSSAQAYDRILQHLEEQNATLFATTLETIAESRADAKESRKESREYADSIREIGAGIASVTASVVGAIQSAAELTKSFSEENAAVQLARIAQEDTNAKYTIVTELLEKVAAPALGEQIRSTLAKRRAKSEESNSSESKSKKTPPTKTKKKKSKQSEPDGKSSKTEDRDGFPKNCGKKLQSIFVDLDQAGNLEKIQAILGDECFKCLADAAESGRNSHAREALTRFRAWMDDLLETAQFDALGRMSALQNIMGENLIERFTELIPKSAKEPK